MSLQKQDINISFGQGLDQKTDPYQVPAGKMLSLNNAVFTKSGLLQKRNGFKNLRSLSNYNISNTSRTYFVPPITTFSNLSTYSGSLLAIGTSLQVLSSSNDQWFNKGTIVPVDLSVIPVVRTSKSKTTVDIAVAPNNLACAVFTDSSSNCFYQIVDSTNGQIIVSSTALPATSTLPRVFLLGNNFIITFLATVSAVTHLQYIAISSYNVTSPGSAVSINTQASSLTAGYDGCVANNTLFTAVDASDGGGAIRINSMSSSLNISAAVVISGKTSNLMSVVADTSTNTAVIWFTFWNSGDNNGWTAVYDFNLNVIHASVKTINNIVISELTSLSSNNVLTVFYQTLQSSAYGPFRSDYISSVTCTTAGTVGSPAVVIRSLGLASKAFVIGSTAYMLAAINLTLQPTYFLIDSSGNVISKLAYQNGGGYYATQILPSVTVTNNLAQIGYLFKDVITSVNSNIGATGTNATSNIYSQVGLNLASFIIDDGPAISAEIANNIHFTGGFLWQYDGVKPVEQNFHVFPDCLTLTTSTSGGLITADTYTYFVTYEWTDAQGILHRSAPSIGISVVTSGSTSTNTLVIPYLRVTYKVSPNPVNIVIYRYSVTHPVPYQITSITAPQVNSTSSDSLSYADTVADSSIIGNTILYTNGGIIPNKGPIPCSVSTIYKNRLFLLDSEDRNTLWYSKIVLENTPVEMSNLLTLYIPPTTSSQGNTGPITALSTLDDKLIIFKKDAIYYVVGNGPDSTGSNNDYSDAIFITSTVGCSNQQSIITIPNGLMFQSDKGIWLLGRDLSTQYIGAPVESYNKNIVLSAITIPGTNQVRFTLDNGSTLMYDYYFNQWGVFSGISNISSIIYQGLHTFLNQYGEIFQENQGSYLDGSRPTLLSFTTAWIKLAGLQGFQRAYFFYLLGQYLSPHKLNIGIAYDYNPSIQQTELISPDNYSSTYANGSYYGGSTPFGSPFGGPSNVEQWRVYFDQQKCESFQLTVNEIYDPSLGVSSGAGLTISGLNMVIGSLSSYPRLKNGAANAI